ncbi:ribosomal protein S18 acetylase RimI-like enzyme [Hydrogenophaga palleronii]|uniref:Ribosomal protein S18 acetylase RimI-like enzyme n=1 Tax=Hydrogenophaga palleronii TaxID=65655 RepID=A0ABU1WJW6_9BURK|nr:GNAT family N-acetyltransferase [Hydrogenophaga palleronii]MDR7149562.1 ribosomal protein S18 acetylase RimI-like enzyme [Hydrogenophaga palleronii]
MRSFNEVEMRIREFSPELDSDVVRTCICELQDFGRAQDARMPPGRQISSRYLADLQEKCAMWKGAIFVAESGGQVVGFISVLAAVPVAEPLDGVTEEARVVDLYVADSARGLGLGKMLMTRAVSFVASHSARWLRVSVFAQNTSALEMYKKFGFSELELSLELDLKSQRLAQETP